MKTKSSLIGLSLTLVTLSLSSNAFSYEDSFERTQDKIADAAHSAAETASQIASETQSAFSVGLKEGKVESILFFNKHLNGYSLDADVDGTHVTLTGTVAQDIERDYAEQLALSIDGIESVSNKIQIDKQLEKSTLNSTKTKFTSSIKDASITASIKTKLLANSNISGLKVKVSTDSQKVLLQGEASSALEKDLIEQIAANTSGVNQVINQIQIIR
ncbi:MAG TPA: hypothetical protein DHW71_11240 [Gammaproteobacteria bacterium]|nr:hypothetical protein [Gammaproteobacteria bacterium]HCK93557.1 hypothetical protein [Gammaproteobacteria bacterium]|tara:strand:+ start:50777 stop:51424 length:648 start_codon:yes stop_codon:yes gene_type:complete